MGLEDKLPNGILLTNLERFVNYSCSTSLWAYATAWVTGPGASSRSCRAHYRSI